MSTSITHHDEASRFTIELDGQTAGHLDYTRNGDVWSLVSTHVDPAFGGRGVGSKLVLGVLEQIGEVGGKVHPVCPFVQPVIDKNPEILERIEVV